MILAILLALSAWLLSFLLPWWSLAIPALLLGAAAGKTGWSSFGDGFAGIGGLWLIQTLWIHLGNDGLLTSRVAELFNLPHPSLVITATVVLGGLAGGLSALTGYLFGKIFLSKPRSR